MNAGKDDTDEDVIDMVQHRLIKKQPCATGLGDDSWAAGERRRRRDHTSWRRAGARRPDH
jgi:hypothetical protein